MKVKLRFKKETKNTVVYEVDPRSEVSPPIAPEPLETLYLSKVWMKHTLWAGALGFPPEVEVEIRLPARSEP